MAVAASVTAVGAAIGLSGTAALIGGGAIIGAGVGGLYSAITGDGNILNSMLTGGLIGAAGGAVGAAAGAGAGASGAGLTGASGAAGSMGSASALQLGTPALSVAGTAPAAAASGAGLSASAVPSLTSSLSVAAPAAGSGAIGTAYSGLTAAAPMTGMDLLGYGLAGSTAMSLLGGMKQKGLPAGNTGTSSPAMIRPYQYAQEKNPNYGQPGESYYTQSYKADKPYKAANGGLMGMASGGMAQSNMFPQSQQDTVQFAVPSQMPTSAELIDSDFDSTINPYTGDAQRFAEGGQPIDPNMQVQNVPIQMQNKYTLPQNVPPKAVSDYNALLADRANNEYNVQPVPLNMLPGGGQNAGAGDLNKIINQYYVKNVGRQGDQPGLDAWTKQVQNGTSLADINKGIANSAEGQVYSAYTDLLGRRPDEEGMKFWKPAIEKGATPEQIRDAFMNSPEYLAKHPKPVAAPITKENFDAKDYLASNSDVASNPSFAADPYTHYQQYGQKEGRTAKALTSTTSTSGVTQADIDAYKAAHPTNTRTYNPATKTYGTPVPTNAEVAAWKATQVSADMYKAPNGQLWASKADYDNSIVSREANGGLLRSYSKGGKSEDEFSFDDLSNKEKKYFLELMARPMGANQGRNVGPENALEKYMMSQAPQGFEGRIDARKILDSDENQYSPASLRAGLSGIAMKNPGKAGITAMPGAVDVGYRSAQRNQEDPYLDLMAYRSLQATPGKGYAQGVNANYTIPFANGGDIDGGYNLGSYSDGGRLLKGPGDGVSDDIPAVIGNSQPARLADGEFVIPARIVSEIGNGSTDAGAKRLYSMMDNIQAGRKKTVGKGNIAKDTKAKKHLLA